MPEETEPEVPQAEACWVCVSVSAVEFLQQVKLTGEILEAEVTGSLAIRGVAVWLSLP